MPLNRYITAAPAFEDGAQYKHLKMFENSRNKLELEGAPFTPFDTFSPLDLNALVSFNFANLSYALTSPIQSLSKPLYLNGPLHLNGDDYAGDTSTTGLLLASGSTITGEIEIARDEDWFRIELEVDQGILITISSQTAELQYMTIGIHQEDGDFGDYRTNRNGPVQGAFSPHIDTYTSGTYYIGFRGAFEQTGHYTITVSSISDDYSYTPETSGTLIVGGGPTTGQSNFDNDVDWFEFNVTAGDEVEFLLSFNGFSGPAHGDIFDANRNHIASFQSTGVNGEVSVTLIMNTDGPFYVEIISRLPDTLTPQTYTLNAVLLSSGNPVTTDQSSTFTRTGTLQLDAPTYNEAIDIEGDIDVYDFDAVADQNVYFELTMLLAGLIITIHDENGDILQTTPFLDAAQSIIITFTPSKTGVYFIRVAGEIVEDLGDYSIRMFSQSPYNIASEGDDELHGTEGADTISALAGNDTLYGGAGDDRLNGGTGDDALYGEAGQDLFIIGANAGNDQIMDFEDGIDHIQMLGDIYSFSQLKIYQDGNNVIIASANGVTTLMDTDIADIDASDFVFRISDTASKKQGFDQKQFVDFLMQPSELSATSMDVDNNENFEATILNDTNHFDML